MALLLAVTVARGLVSATTLVSVGLLVMAVVCGLVLLVSATTLMLIGCFVRDAGGVDESTRPLGRTTSTPACKYGWRVVGLLEHDVLVGDGVLRAHDWRREVDQARGNLLRGVTCLRPRILQRRSLKSARTAAG
jgi:hypothetical protein